ncbi:MAG: hypothetical protein CVU97_06940 [Firmicutes bacterium HGW-Firmicutes-21]|nr:MAG: hypothetical protein CVU97_06940 [Firmicutes bacterium HGW-Firmicutes-21]
MQLNYINSNEMNQNKLQVRKTKKMFGLAVGCSILMLALLLSQNLFIGAVWSVIKTTELRIFFLIILSVLTLFFPFLILAKKAKISFSESLKVNTDVPNKFWLYIPFTIGAGFVVNIVIRIIFGPLLERFDYTESQLPSSVTGIILYFILAALVPAIFEEWAFRGVLLRSLMPYGKGFALVVSSIIFGFMHLDPARVVFATTFGLLAGFIYMKTGSIWYGALIHLVNNAFALTASFANKTNVDENVASPEAVLVTILMFSFIITAIIGIIYFAQKGYFKTRVMRYVTPPEKPKLQKSQYARLSLLNLTTLAFVIIYLITVIFLYF